MRQRGAQSFDVARSQAVGGEDFNEVRASFVRELSLGGRIGPKHNRPAGRMSNGHQFCPADRCHDELGPCLDGRVACLGVHYRAHAHQRTGANLFAGLANGAQRVRSRHRDFGRDDSARDERLEHGTYLRRLLSADDGDNARVGQHRDDFGFGSHR